MRCRVRSLFASRERRLQLLSSALQNRQSTIIETEASQADTIEAILVFEANVDRSHEHVAFT